MSTLSVPACWKCATALVGVPMPISRHEYCGSCGEALHCCQQCVAFDVRAPGQCAEARAEPPNDRTSANFCEWFVPGPGAAGDAPSAADAARARLEALFGSP